MKNTTHRVVILKNINSDMISQAILFLKDSEGESDTNLMLEAERIVEKYMNTKPSQQPVKNGMGLKAVFFSAGIVLISLGIFIVLKLL